tara:strand:- start:1086 stop:1664 length:579 start_codon:yes stop_codon:yes gene_type:complete
MGNDAIPESGKKTRTGNTQISNNLSLENGQLLPGERVIAELRSDNGGEFQLTHNRIIYNRESRSSVVYSSIQMQDISSIQIFKRPRARRSAIWGIIGLCSAIVVWQVIPNSMSGIIASLAVALISLILIADYWLRPEGVHIEFQTMSGKVSGEVGNKLSEAVHFLQKVEDTRRRLVPRRLGSPFRNYPSNRL